LTGIAKIMTAAVKNLTDGKPFLLVGVSLGTNVLAEMLYNDISPAGVVLAGPCIMGKNHGFDKMVKKGTHVDVVFTADAPEDKILKYARETSLSEDPDDIRSFINDYKQTNREFRGVLASSLVNYRDQVDIVRQKNIPSLVTFGAEEKVIFPDYLDDADLPLWSGRIHKLAGASHLVNIDQPEQFNELMAEYAQDCFR
jgi:pimeloyl-ACP methyl ester carboxylesterase